MTKTEAQLGEAASLLSKMIKCASVTPKEDGVIDLLVGYLENHGFTCHRLSFEGDGSYEVTNLFATRGSSGKHLLFAGHTDVVPEGDHGLWTHPPFAAEIDNGVMFGRGAVDMKSGIACFCAALEKTLQNLPEEFGTISLAITNDEEADAVNGTEKLIAWADAQGYRFDFAIVGEPSSEAKVGDRIKNGRRGSMNAAITVSGSQGHVAYPEKALNPVPVIAELVHKLSTTPLDQGSAAFQPSNLEVTTIDVGNTATNVIPASAKLALNIRFNDLWSAEKLDAWINTRIAETNALGCTITYDRRKRVSEVFVCPKGEGMALLDATITDLFGAAPEHSTNGGTSDARFIAKYCPVVECGLVGETMHKIDECVPLADLDRLTHLYAGFMQRFFLGAK